MLFKLRAGCSIGAREPVDGPERTPTMPRRARQAGSGKISTLFVQGKYILESRVPLFITESDI